MMARSLFVVATAVAVVVADDYKWDCSEEGATCGVVCCAQGYALMGSDGGYWCQASSSSGTDCKLCGSSSLKDCSFGSSNLYASLLDTDENPVDVSTTSTSVTASSSSSALSPTRPSSGVTLTLGTYNGMAGWNDIPDSRFYQFHEFLLGVTATIPSFYTAAGYTVVYSCSSKSLAYVPSTFKGCDIFFFVYRCPPCDAHNGGIGAQLLAMEEPTWYAQNCGPTFKLNYDLGVEHQFAVYTSEIADGASAKVKLAERVEFMFWAMVGKSVICSTRTTKDACDEAPINCEWLEEGVCRPRTCPTPSLYQGPSQPKCQVCIDDEEDFIPEVILN